MPYEHNYQYYIGPPGMIRTLPVRFSLHYDVKCVIGINLNVPFMTAISAIICVCLYISDIQLVEYGFRQDLASCMFLCWLVMLMDRYRKNWRRFDRIWMLACVTFAYYLFSQFVMLFMWHPFWEHVDDYLMDIYDSNIAFIFYQKIPFLIIFLRNNTCALLKLTLMMYIAYKALMDQFFIDILSEGYGPRIHEHTIHNLFRAATGNRAIDGQMM